MLAFVPSKDDETGSPMGLRPLLATSHPLIVDRHRERLEDADDGVRLAALDGSAAILKAAAAIDTTKMVPSSCQELLAAATALVPKLNDRSLDPNDAIRMRTMEIVLDVAAMSIAGYSLLEPVMLDMSRRVLDKKVKVREACADMMAGLYAKHALPRWIAGQHTERLAWIPQQLSEAYLVLHNTGHGQVAQLEDCNRRAEQDHKS